MSATMHVSVTGDGWQLNPLLLLQNGDAEGWVNEMIFEVSGVLPREDGWDADKPAPVDEDVVLAAMRAAGYPIAGQGCSGAGQPFADPPWCQYFTRVGDGQEVMVVSQRGGLDI